MKRALGIVMVPVLAVLVGAEGRAEEDSKAKALEILQKADAATRAVKSVRYRGHSQPSGVAERFFSAAEGEGIVMGWASGIPERFWAHVKTTRPRGDEPVELTGGGDGDSYFIIDHRSRKGYEDMDPAVMGSGARTLQSFVMAEFVDDAPFDDELGAEELEYQGIEVVEGIECHKIHITYRGGQQESTWFFSTEDFLPRRSVRHFDIPQQGEGAVVMTVSKLEVDPVIDPKIFKLVLPDGYEQIDDFAP